MKKMTKKKKKEKTAKNEKICKKEKKNKERRVKMVNSLHDDISKRPNLNFKHFSK